MAEEYGKSQGKYVKETKGARGIATAERGLATTTMEREPCVANGTHDYNHRLLR